jgi:hypothetical protein
VQTKIITVTLFLLAGLNGCTSIGPSTVARDRFDYTTAISDSWKAQMLLNVVKLRYADAPVFLDVASVINQYGFQGTVGVSGSWFQNPADSLFGSASQNVTAQGIYLDRPTITYSPLSGEKFARSHDSDPACGDSKFSPGRLSGRLGAAALCACHQWYP